VFIRARDIVHQYDGIVNKIGASPQGAYLMVLFGAPQAHEDDPLRAVLAALELQERAELPLRIGINSGFVFAGNVGTVERREYTVMGDEVNLAYRLMAASEPGKIWLGPNTARHPIIQRRVGGEPGTPQKFKGKSGLITPFIARSVRRIFTGAETEAIPLIGRDEELQQLTSALEQLQTGTPQVVTLHGPAGIGKSRLAHEVAALAGEVGVNVYQGTAPSYGAHLPYAAWERPLLDLLDLQNVPQEERERAFEQALTRYDLGHWGALLAPLIGLDIPPTPEIAALSPEQREEQRQNTLCALWAQAAQQTPALLIMENAHWMPPSSMTLLNAIVQAEADAPLMLLITYRDDQAFARAWQDQAEESDRQTWRAMEWRTIPLNPLPRRAIVQLARHIAGASRLPPEVERWIARRGSGIPLFTIEAVRTLLTSGVLVRENGDWRLTQPLEEAPLPETAYGMIQSRIDQLEPPSRHLLRAATVVGEQMTVPMLVAGYGEEPRPTVQRRLA
ncbi:MAG TPA: hypothetical protein ENO16_01360, partial [Chromatiales bacterium]|nr:hypothetical protein [Chromatiales bacterium]